VNDQARRLFTSSFAYAQSTDGDQHLKYFGQGEHHPAMSDQDGSTSYDEEDKAVPEPHLHPGYYVFSLDKDLLPEIPAHGWRVGKGSNRGGKMVEVDILLSKPRDPRGKKLAGVHLLLHFHPRSWMFMLVAGSTQKTVEYYVNGQFKTLAFPSRHVLCEQTNRLRLGDCEYDLIYTVADHLQKGFMAYNAEVLERFGHGRYDGPSPGIQTFPPKNGFTKSGEVLICSTLSYGGQGWVFAGVEMASGEPVAVKEISVKSTKQFRQASSEWEYGKSFQVDQPSQIPTLQHANDGRACLAYFPLCTSGANTTHPTHAAKFPRRCSSQPRLLSEILRSSHGRHARIGLLNCRSVGAR
jgi:hypothetical protein